MVQTTDDQPTEETPEENLAEQESVEVSDETSQNPDVLMIQRLDEMIKNHISSIAKTKEELGKHREMLKDSFEGDTVYREHAEEAKKANKIKNATKQQILRRPEVAQIADKVKTLGQELRELNSALSDYLAEYQRVSGLNEVEGEDGEIRQIVFVAKLSSKPFKR